MHKNLPGEKHDEGKLLAGILYDFALALECIAECGTFGAKKYSRGNWQRVDEGIRRYWDGFWRHLLKSRHEEFDKESGKPHRWHMLWNLTAWLELYERDYMERSKHGNDI